MTRRLKPGICISASGSGAGTASLNAFAPVAFCPTVGACSFPGARAFFNGTFLRDAFLDGARRCLALDLLSTIAAMSSYLADVISR